MLVFFRVLLFALVLFVLLLVYIVPLPNKVVQYRSFKHSD